MGCRDGELSFRRGVVDSHGETSGLEKESSSNACADVTFTLKERGPKPAFLCPRLWRGGC